MMKVTEGRIWKLVEKDGEFWQKLVNIRRGIEKESLRVDSGGRVSQRPHPKELGSALCFPYVTTDYSEALIELVTPTFNSYSGLTSFLNTLHCWIYSHIGDELLWPFSMPCRFNSDDHIPLAQYGSSYNAQMKTLYRKGLTLRYGGKIQSISGIHYNMSFPLNLWEHLQNRMNIEGHQQDFINKSYFHIMRNFHHYSFLLTYWFGATPIIDSSFPHEQFKDRFSKRDENTLFSKDATCLRMTRMGYQNKERGPLNISLNCLNEYVSQLQSACETPYDPFVKIGLKDKSGDYLQLNNNLLQIENEYYSIVRPKRPTHPGERPTVALNSRGVEYLEIRLLDVNPFAPVGVTEEQLKIVDLLIMYCLLSHSEHFTNDHWEEFHKRQELVQWYGCNDKLSVPLLGESKNLLDLINELSDQLILIAEKLDEHNVSNCVPNYVETLSRIKKSKNLSSQLLEELSLKNMCYQDFAFNCANKYKNLFLNNKRECQKENKTIELFETLSKQSWKDQVDLENRASVFKSFEEFLDYYYQQGHLIPHHSHCYNQHVETW